MTGYTPFLLLSSNKTVFFTESSTNDRYSANGRRKAGISDTNKGKSSVNETNNVGTADSKYRKYVSSSTTKGEQTH